MSTPDGIKDSDWERLKDLIATLAGTAGTNDEKNAEKEIMEYLEQLERRYGPLPSILATRADFVDEYEKKEELFKQAYAAAAAAGDLRNSLEIAHSLAELYIEELINVGEAREWLDRLDAHLLNCHDSTYAEDARKFREQLRLLDG